MSDGTGHEDGRRLDGAPGRPDTPDDRASAPETGGDPNTERRSGDSTELVDDLKRQLDEKHDRMLRALAEAENVRRRVERTAEDRVRYANESLLRDLIPVLDNFDRAMAAARAAGNAPALVEGVELIQRELLRVLERAGVRRYSAVGETFDPTRHEAVSRLVSATAAPNTVVAETAPGYLLNGRVLRAALVAVAAAPDEDAA